MKHPARRILSQHWIGQFRADNLRADIFAGLTGAAMVLPQGIAFAIIAGLPPEYGLYTSIVSATVAALFGASMLMVSGATTVLSALLYSSLHDLAPLGSAQYINYALVTALLVGLFQCIAGLVRMGRLVSFVSGSVLIGFTAVAAILIATSQISGALGLDAAPNGTVVERLFALSGHLTSTSPAALVISAASFGCVALLARFAPRLPGFIIALVLGSLLAWFMKGAGHEVTMIAALSAPLPRFTVPEIGLANLALLGPGAAAIAIIGLLEAVSIGRSFALRRNQYFDANREIIGQGLSNLVGGFFQCYPSSGSFTRSAVNWESGARTPFSVLVASAVLALGLLYFSDLITLIPLPAISGLILYVSWRLIHFREIRHLLKSGRSETIVLTATIAAGLMVSLEASVYSGVIASFAVFLWQSARPDVIETAPAKMANGSRKFRNVKLLNLPECPQLLSLRLDGPLYFGSADHVAQAIRAAEARRAVAPDVALILKGVGQIDLAGAEMLAREISRVQNSGRRFHVVAPYPPLARALEKFGVLEVLAKDCLHASKWELVIAGLKTADPAICATCTARIFHECPKVVLTP